MKNKIQILKGKNILLRAPKLKDKKDRLEGGVHKEIKRMFGGDHRNIKPLTNEDVESWYESRHKRIESAYRAWVIDLNGKCIGIVALEHYNKNNRNAQLSIGMFSPENCGKGYGTEAINLVLEYAFKKLKLHRISLIVLAYNKRAIACYKKCGFKKEGVIRDSAYIAGKWEDDILMGILNSDHKNRN